MDDWEIGEKRGEGKEEKMALLVPFFLEHLDRPVPSSRLELRKMVMYIVNKYFYFDDRWRIYEWFKRTFIITGTISDKK